MSPTLLDSSRVREYLRQHVVLSVPTAEKVVSLTFDDGPSPRNTPALLDALESLDIRATFFLLGSRARRLPDLVHRIADGGHQLGTHGDFHVPWVLLPPTLLRREIERSRDSIERAGGQRPGVCRPPYGWVSPPVLDVLRSLDCRPVIGDVYPQDSRRPGTRRIVDRIVGRVGPGSVIILHDGGWHDRVDRGQTIEAVIELAPRLEHDGYRFATLAEMLGSAAEQLP